MTETYKTLFCLVDGEPIPFPVEIEPTKTIGSLKKAIKDEKTPRFDDVAADELILWRVSIPVLPKKDRKEISLAAVPSKEELDETDEINDVFEQTLPKKTIHIIVQRPLPALKRRPEYEPEHPQKLLRTSDWVTYDAEDGPVDLPHVLVNMLNSEQFSPAPRDEFIRQLDNVQVGQQIKLPSIGQRPKHYGEGYQALSFFVTEQMIEMWKLLSGNSDRPIRRVLSGPMGSANPYAEGWLLLYVSDANELAKNNDTAIARAICARFLALNKDILTVDNFKEMTFLQPIETEVFSHAATNILGELLQQPKTKTLLIIDEHGALFEQEPPVPKKFPILNPLMQLAAWRETSQGARVVLTGTAHAKFERQYVKSDMWDWLEFVTPLSDIVFDRLLHLDKVLSRTAIKDLVKTITNRVPRELVNLATFVHRNMATVGQQPASIVPGSITDPDSDVSSLMTKYQEQRHKAFYQEAYLYFTSLDDVQRHSHRNAIAAIFLPRKEGDFDFENKGFDYPFMDLGLVYRIKVGAGTEYRSLCPAAYEALFDIYKSMPLLQDTVQWRPLQVRVAVVSGQELFDMEHVMGTASWG
ncbi:hypothetical protein BGZ83_001320 [Gryganskiella cystojenkinii]|nr:hypothetical protein BGZ83_001320 [Gryganskiella cystojenkinii]